MPTDVHLSFEDDDHREAVTERLREFLPVPDGELVESGADVIVRVPSDHMDWATARAREIVRGALDGTDIAVPGFNPGGGWAGA
jgi:hypothetical protein